MHQNDTGLTMASLLYLASIAAAASLECSPETFTFPSILGTEHVSTTAAIVRNYTGFPSLRPEPALEIPAAGVDPFCNVTVSYTHPGHDDAVNLHVWLPLSREAWNGRFMGVGGGGFAAGDVDGDSVALAVQRGYVAATTDGGHLQPVSVEDWALKSPGNVDWPALFDFSYRALHEIAVIGKSVAEEYFGEEARWSYWQGCSTGGRQALAVAWRFPGDWDGVLAMAPAVEFPVVAAWTYYPQLVMNEKGWFPSECELAAVWEAEIEACDATDGKMDGIIGRLGVCSFDVGSVVGRKFECDGVAGTVSEKTVELVKLVMKGLHDEEDKLMFPGFPPGSPLAGLLGLMNSVCEDEAARENCTGVPFDVSTQWMRLFVEKDPAFDPASMTLEQYRDVFRRGVEEYDSIIGGNPDLRRFREKGGKVLMWQGMADQIIPMGAVQRHYRQAKEIDAARGFETEEYWRYFEVPGLEHCIPLHNTPFPFNMTESLRRWVEEGVAPEQLDGRTVEEGQDGKKVLSKEVRKICLWPEEGVWDGQAWNCVKSSWKKKGRQEL